MKRTEAKELISKLNSYKEFNYALVFHQDVFTKEIIPTYMLSSDSFEIKRWLEQKISALSKHDVPYVAYTNGGFEDCNNKLSFEE